MGEWHTRHSALPSLVEQFLGCWLYVESESCVTDLSCVMCNASCVSVVVSV